MIPTYRFLAAALALVLILPACSSEPQGESFEPSAESSPAPAADTVAFETNDEKILYALGMALSQNIVSFGLTEAEVAVVQAGLADGALGVEPRVSMEEIAPQLPAFTEQRLAMAAQPHAQASAEYLERMAAEPGATRTDSGLIFIEITPGSGPSPTVADTVRVHYHGTLPDGTVFDSSMDRGVPATMPLNRVIDCWSEGLQLMSVGGRGRIVCPASIAYGNRGMPPKIPPGAALTFEVELLAIAGR
ncbi:MAG: FKBP-type peptidyl-prolyl cis-trans isomerase [bacterium]|nr:FKBP-type peptidyl-prolyl cis-trans isomerase [bacterium]